MLPLRLCRIAGYEGRVNDVVYCCSRVPSNNISVFFGGDVQDFAENMIHNESKPFLKWNLENTAYLIGKVFPQSNIMVVKPSRVKYKTFSCYKNFVESSDYGVPVHTSSNHSLNHLKLLLDNTESRLRSMDQSDIINSFEKTKKHLFDADLKEENTEMAKNFSSIIANTSFNNGFIRVMGFSKGCVVLNQFLYEFHNFKTTENSNATAELDALISRIKEMYWIDGGHSGGKNTWITSRQILETFAGLGIKTYIHVSPYQIEDRKRPWIKKEEKLFYEILKNFGVNINRKLHFEDQPPSLELHFNILNELQFVEKTNL